MYDEDELDRIKRMQKDWETTILKEDLEKKGEWKSEFKTLSGIQVRGSLVLEPESKILPTLFGRR